MLHLHVTSPFGNSRSACDTSKTHNFAQLTTPQSTRAEQISSFLRVPKLQSDQLVQSQSLQSTAHTSKSQVPVCTCDLTSAICFYPIRSHFTNRLRSQHILCMRAKNECNLHTTLSGERLIHGACFAKFIACFLNTRNFSKRGTYLTSSQHLCRNDTEIVTTMLRKRFPVITLSSQDRMRSIKDIMT